MKALISIVCLAAALLVLTPAPAAAQNYYRRVSNVWHPRSSAYLSRPTYRLQPYGYNLNNYGRYNFNLRQIYGNSYGPRVRYNARPSFNYNARPQFRYNARPQFRYNARPQF